MANSDKWTIENDSTSPAVGNDLNGIRIKKTGSGYELYAVLASTTSNTPPLTFNNVQYDGQSWNIVFTSLPVGNNGAGTWALLDSVTGDQADGDFTAQASGGQDDDAEAASSASA